MKSACSFLCLLVFKPKLSLPRFLCHSGPTWANLGPNHFSISYICILYIWFYFESHENLKLHGFMRLACQAKKIDARDCFSYMELEDLMLVSGFSNRLQKRRSRPFALLAVDSTAPSVAQYLLSAVTMGLPSCCVQRLFSRAKVQMLSASLLAGKSWLKPTESGWETAPHLRHPFSVSG